MSSEFEFRGLRCIPAPGGERSWHYLPRLPDVRRDVVGSPQLTIADLGDTGYLLFTATWGANETDLEALRHELAVCVGDPSAARVLLSFAPVSALRCQALVGDGAGSFETVATSSTSGVPPYDAVFNLALRDERLVHARAGLKGGTNFLALEYQADLRMPVVGSATLTATTGPLTASIHARQGEEGLHQLLEEAVRQGLADVTVEVPDAYLGLLATTLYDRVLAEAARALPNWLDHHAPGDLRISVTLEEQAVEPVRAYADIGSIVAEASTRAAPGGLHAAD